MQNDSDKFSFFLTSFLTWRDNNVILSNPARNFISIKDEYADVFHRFSMCTLWKGVETETKVIKFRNSDSFSWNNETKCFTRIHK